MAAREGRVEEATKLLALVIAHPFTAHAQREQAKASLAALSERVDVDVFAQRVDAGTRSDLDTIVQQLADDQVLDAGEILISVKPGSDEALLDDMSSLRHEILANRGGETITADILEQVRFERDDDLINLL